MSILIYVYVFRQRIEFGCLATPLIVCSCLYIPHSAKLFGRANGHLVAVRRATNVISLPGKISPTVEWTTVGEGSSSSGEPSSNRCYTNTLGHTPTTATTTGL